MATQKTCKHMETTMVNEDIKIFENRSIDLIRTFDRFCNKMKKNYGKIDLVCTL